MKVSTSDIATEEKREKWGYGVPLGSLLESWGLVEHFGDTQKKSKRTERVLWDGGNLETKKKMNGGNLI